MLLKSVSSVFERSASASETLIAPFLALNRPVFDPDAIAARRRLLRRASKFLDTLIRWRKYAGEKFGIGDLCIRHLNNIVLPIAESGWEVGGEEITREVIDRNVGCFRKLTVHILDGCHNAARRDTRTESAIKFLGVLK
jgi:GC-rich sequence DNA-binding factor